jgi:phenylalanine-4-hydroxylase
LPGSQKAIPPHLLQFVVEQDYEQYTAVDQAVWRFVLLQLSTRLSETAHPAYRDGLARSGISPEHIPRIEEMNDKLGHFGWGAVCVDGFIPPRAFVEFQAAGLLPIAADMRTLEHLVYTPAPDIIHEAAGHAPILSDPEYAAYIARSGQVGARAFTLPRDRQVYEAIYTLSEVKENPEATPRMVQAAERELERVLATESELSEASRLARLYWWTAEYGLVGRVDDYKLYGAGLLSSLWESHSCHDAQVKKLPLDAGVVDVAYDITQPQPQLFVARDFAQLQEVLSEVERTLAVNVGGPHALGCAERSQELATLVFSSGLEAIGVVRSARLARGELAAIELGGPVAFARSGAILPELGPARQPGDQWLLLGIAEEIAPGELRYPSGFRVEGALPQPIVGSDGRINGLFLAAARVVDPEHGEIFEGALTLVELEHFVTARAGASDPAYYPATRRSTVRVPKPRRLPAHERELLELYERALRASRGDSVPALREEFARVHAELGGAFPGEWLLRWNLLESLLKVGEKDTLSPVLIEELEALEVRYEYRQPIASGLRYLRQRFSLSS